MQTYMVYNDLFNHEGTNVPTQSHLVMEEDFIISEDGKSSIRLRFKNCTGNTIKLLGKDPIVDPELLDLTQAQIALSIDPLFKN